MSESETDQSKTSAGTEKSAPVAPWLRASLADLRGLDFEEPIANSISADPNELSELFSASTIQNDNKTKLPDTAATRVASLLAAITGMCLQSDNNEPFRARIEWADGTRSAIPSDFNAEQINLLAELTGRTQHPVLRTRLADICWFLDRKRVNLGLIALTGYQEIVAKGDKGDLLFRFENQGDALVPAARDLLGRALHIGRKLGFEKPDSMAVRETVVMLRKRAAEMKRLVPLHWFAELDLDFYVSDPSDVARDIDKLLESFPNEEQPRFVVELWRLAARAYQLAKNDEDRFRCQAAAAEHLVLNANAAQKNENSAILVAHQLSTAIAQLHGIPSMRERRKELRHQLIDVQARIPEELSTYSQKIDLQEIAEQVEKTITKTPFIDKLFIFASLSTSPDPEQLIQSARKSIQKFPLRSFIPTSLIDGKGKVIHRTEGHDGNFTQNAVLANQISREEAIRRHVTSFGQIEPARRIIINEHALSDDLLKSLLQYSPFIPEQLVATFARGFLRFFQGDFISALYILTPLLENSLRHVLQVSGYDVSIFDDATLTQEDRTISKLFEQMRPELDGVFTKSITTDLENVFLTKSGPHLRHAVAHGLLQDNSPFQADAIYACWFIYRLCLIPLIQYRKELALEEM